ncbi:hypothetical protein [Rhizobium sp. CC-YZS058]|uniref:hypothetical protein n=1 Tax=Rhizobium sp. CC-YZS058 TaxID=3042153 RepID=UPI002B05862E|nr:hypothetical protein [Rhizobium sp. CC-YZS058]MEA3533429.1 hypothetical protein [Rhizobium sp. CC-YZS058]
MTEEKKKRRPKSGPALGNIDETKTVVEAMLDAEKEAARQKTERLRALRLQQQQPAANRDADEV